MFIIVSIYVYVSSLLFFIVCLFFNCIEIAKYHFNLLTYDQNWPIFTSHQKFQEVKPDTDVLGDRAVAPEMDKSLSNTAPARTKGWTNIVHVTVKRCEKESLGAACELFHG